MEAFSAWYYNSKNEIAVRINRNFYATSSKKYGIDKDGMLLIRHVTKNDEGFYKFRLVCGRDVEINRLIRLEVRS